MKKSSTLRVNDSDVHFKNGLHFSHQDSAQTRGQRLERGEGYEREVVYLRKQESVRGGVSRWSVISRLAMLMNATPQANSCACVHRSATSAAITSSTEEQVRLRKAICYGALPLTLKLSTDCRMGQKGTPTDRYTGFPVRHDQAAERKHWSSLSTGDGLPALTGRT